ncbi:MAG TPA: glycosyltransferase family 4 protein, partial [Candidatus Binatia bacterium]|nr:glycosyltransferase family 4 protein [Candidatus Binatia bacterium]
MQVLLINQFFWPDTAATGQLLTDVAREIDPESHAVTVLCGKSVYGAVDSVSPPPVKIVQCAGLAFSRGKVGRVVSYAAFVLGAMAQGVRGPKPELVLTLTTPPLISLVGTLLKRLRGAQHFIWEMDVYPDIAVDLNVLKQKSIVTRVVGFLADFPRKRADGIIALGEDMKARLVARGIAAEKILVAENWADGEEIVPGPFSDGPLVVHYSGTFGLAHEERTIALAMRALRNDDRFRFVFVGGGARRGPLE